MGLLDPIAGFGITLKTFFSKTFTEAYPTGPKITAPRYHGRHQLNRWPDGLEKCVGCELCAWACPADAIYVEGASNTEDERFSPGERYGRVYQINYLRCILCGLCIEACPTRALTMTNNFELSDFTREDMIYEKHQLLAPVLPGMTAPPHERMLGGSEKEYFLGLPETRPLPADSNAGLPNVGWNKKDRAEAQAEVAELYANTPGRGDAPPGPPSVSGVAIERDGVRGSESGRPALESGQVDQGERDGKGGERMIVPLSLGAQFAFWILMPVMILGALGTILAKKPVHSALSLAAVMLSLAVQYAAQQAPFLFAVQIIVYTGAILMLFLFVMMIVGVDTSESLVETIKGQRLLAILAGVGFFVLLIVAIGNAVVGQPSGLAQANAAHGGNVQGLAALIFGRYVIAFEATSALLITAALGAMVLAHRERLTKKKTQGDLVNDRMQAYAQTGAHPGAMPPPGVYARHNAVDTPALLATGEVAETSVSATLKARGVVQNPADLIAPTQATVKAIAPERADRPATAVASFVEHAKGTEHAKRPEPVEGSGSVSEQESDGDQDSGGQRFQGQRVLRQAQEPQEGRAQESDAEQARNSEEGDQ